LLAVFAPRTASKLGGYTEYTNLAIVVYVLVIFGWIVLLSRLLSYVIPLTLFSRRTCLQCGYDLRAIPPPRMRHADAVNCRESRRSADVGVGDIKVISHL